MSMRIRIIHFIMRVSFNHTKLNDSPINIPGIPKTNRGIFMKYNYQLWL